MVNFESDEARQERDIDIKTREITDLFHHAENVLKRFAKQSEDPSITEADRTVRKNMQMSMAKKIQGLSMSFRSSQKVYNYSILFYSILFASSLCVLSIA
jgi:hypothetical protein